MLENKHLKQLIKLTPILVLAILISLLFGNETTLQDQMQDALDSHDHENALIFASELLEKEPNNLDAIAVIKKSGQIFLYLHLAQTELPDYRVAKDQQTEQVIFYVQNGKPSFNDLGIDANKKIVKPEKVYQDLQNASDYAFKAKQIDSDFKTTLNFEKSLDKAQAYVLNILANNVLEAGKHVYSKISKNYETKSNIIESAAASDYLDIFLASQSAWAPMETPIEEIKKSIEPILNSMDNTGQLVSNYQSGKSEKLTQSILSYTKVTKQTADVLLLPQGSYKEFVLVADNAANAYKEAQNGLRRAIPSVNAKNFSKLINAIVEQKLFEHDSSVDLIDKNHYLQSAYNRIGLKTKNNWS